jgi:broad specificity phosphatase PhoE
MEHIEKRWLIILRHGESEGNVDEQIYKDKPTSELKLTETGKKQATSAGRSIVSQIVRGRVAIFCSSFDRALGTMEKVKDELSAAGIEIKSETILDDLKEQKYGNAAGLAYIADRKESRQKYDNYEYCFPQGSLTMNMILTLLTSQPSGRRGVDGRCCKADGVICEEQAASRRIT